MKPYRRHDPSLTDRRLDPAARRDPRRRDADAKHLGKQSVGRPLSLSVMIVVVRIVSE